MRNKHEETISPYSTVQSLSLEPEVFSFPFPLPSTYLPETPFHGRWPSQFASSLNKHFTGERLDLHLPIAGHRTHTHTHTHNHTHWGDGLKLALMLTTKISFSHNQMRQTSRHNLGYTLDCGVVDFFLRESREEQDSALGELNKCVALCLRARGVKGALEHYVLYKSPDSQLPAS